MWGGIAWVDREVFFLRGGTVAKVRFFKLGEVRALDEHAVSLGQDEHRLQDLELASRNRT
jgi:hypothetical protein